MANGTTGMLRRMEVTVDERDQLGEALEIVRRIGDNPNLSDAEKLEQIERTTRDLPNPRQEAGR